jgi:DNA-directed RNA polymerase subunit M/transcription elongation factor TFIIS
MTAVNIACPKCAAVFRGSDEVEGKRIRCPSCGFAFVADKFVDDEQARKAKPKAVAAPTDDDEDRNPLGVKTLDLSPRCPNCANEMASEDAVVCIYCGYNTQTRTVGVTRRLAYHTTKDKILWLLPGIGAALVILLLIFGQHWVILSFAASHRGESDWVDTWICNEPISLWLTMIISAVTWGLGLFVFNRLVLHASPPEIDVY